MSSDNQFYPPSGMRKVEGCQSLSPILKQESYLSKTRSNGRICLNTIKKITQPRDKDKNPPSACLIRVIKQTPSTVKTLDDYSNKG